MSKPVIAADIDTAEHMLLQRQLRWIGHVIRMPFNRLPRRLLYGELLNGQRMPGGPKLHYKDHIRRILKKSNIPISDLEKLATDRYMEKCLRQWLEHTLSCVRSSSCRSTLPQAPLAQPNSNWSQMSAMQPSVCLRVWPAQPPS